jgi:hypothetical protein
MAELNFIFKCPYISLVGDQYSFIFPEYPCDIICETSHNQIATLGLYPEPSLFNIATLGFDITCNLNIFIEFEFFSGETIDCILENYIILSNDQISGENVDVDLITEIKLSNHQISGEFLTCDLQTIQPIIHEFSFEIYNDENLEIDLTTNPITHGGSALEVIDINDSRRKVTVSVVINNRVSQHSIFIDVIKMSNILMTAKPQITIEKKNIIVKATCLANRRQNITIECTNAHQYK